MMECCWPMYNVTWYLYHIMIEWMLNYKTEIYNWNQTGFNNSIKSSNKPAWPHQLLVCMSLRKRVFWLLKCSYNVWYVNNKWSIWVRTKVSQAETHHPTHRFRHLFLDLLLMGWRECASSMRMIKTPIPLFYSENHYVIDLYIAT